MTVAQKDAIKKFMGLADMNERSGVIVHERNATAQEAEAFTALREKGIEVVLVRGGEFHDKKTGKVVGAYCTFRTKDGQTGKVPVRDPKGAQAKFATVYLEKKGLVRPIVNQSGEILDGLVYEVTEDKWCTVSPTGTLEPSADRRAAQREAEIDLEGAEKRADIRIAVAEKMAELESAVVVDIEAMARRRLVEVRGYSEAEVAAIVI